MTATSDRDFSPAEHAELALLLEVAGTPKPGNVDRTHDLDDLRFEHFLAGSVGSRRGLQLAEEGARVGEAFEHGVAGMSQQRGGNTQFGCLLLLVTLVRAAASDDHELTPEGVTAVVESTTVADAADFYRAFEHVDVAVDDPPADAPDLDVRRGAGAIPTLEERGLTLADVMAMSEERDGNAREWTGGFARTFATAESILADDGPVLDRASRAFVDLLAEEPDTLVATQHGPEVAREVSRRAAEVQGDPEAVERLADEFVAEGLNPGTTADITAAALFVALERGLPV
ncbi:triphosphoribosyl-dephospho-CoA synthase [Halogranum gelatinilyticum]|uniref:Triphosphoribosyl-dephospho-CoA synthase n=1 Tax=Halogranum gelatinilyticum TaxID=660521 RepID=A0A1G9TAZ5_9EURY|nr:triphosphoribosyl-dephospho-CoA synthase [Halogranum gelatinilyticum]SDM44840.1 triphosphoribosyl-dephospho-CoA synthase [Halogranum gelatinilyticum]